MDEATAWGIVGHSVRGASHIRAGIPNQDAIHWLPRSEKGPPLILAVSDGHGSSKSFRSDVGSRLAVERTAWLVQDLLDGQPDRGNLSAIKRTAEERLPKEIVRRWQIAVAAHLKKYPFTEEELATIAEKRGERGRQQILDNPRLAYGATILAVLAAQDFLLFLQLGDGDILTVMEDGQVLRPMPRDPRLIANETTSLCMDDAWREMRCHFQTLSGQPPALVLVSTDGYANSFVNEAAFLRVGSDILEMMCERGVRAVSSDIPSWLREASEAGSGDDITLGVLYRMDVVPEDVPEGEAADPETCKAGDDATGAGASEGDAAPEPKAETGRGAATSRAAAAEEAPEAAKPKPDASPDGDAAPEARARVVRLIKQKGPREQAKQATGFLEDDEPDKDR
jgi:serine/threonine protein phosphatase PrpC